MATKSEAKRTNKRLAKDARAEAKKAAKIVRRAMSGLSKDDLLDVACTLHATTLRLQADKESLVAHVVRLQTQLQKKSK